MPANAGRKPSYQHMDRNTTEPYIVVARIEKSTSGNSQYCITLYNIMHNFIQGSPDNRWKRVWITSSHKFAKVGLKMPGKYRQTNKSWGSFGCVIVWKNYLDIKVDKERKGKLWPDMYIHFHDNCLKIFSEIFYAPDQSLDFWNIKIDPKTNEKLTEADKTLLSSLGIK